MMDEQSYLKDILAAAAVFAVFAFAGKAVIIVLDRIVRKITEKTETQLDDMLLAVVEKPAFKMIVLWGAYVALHRLSQQLGQGIFDVADKAVFILAVALVVKLVYDVINVFIDWYGMKAAEKGQEDIGRSILPLFKKLVKIFAVISGLIVILDHFHYNISSLVAALGVSSLAVGLAAKETLSNMISGFTIAVDRPFRIGDRIELDGKTGDVLEIGLRSTKVRTVDNTLVIIPNSKLVDNVVLNYAYPDHSLTDSLKVGVEYGSDVEKVRRALLAAAAAVPEIMSDPAPAVLFLEHADWALMFRLVYKIPSYTMKWQVLDRLNTAVDSKFREEGINIAFPTSRVYVNSQGEAS